MAKQKEVRVSTRTEDQVKGSGSLFDDIDVVFRNPRYEPWTYPKSNVEVPALGIDMEREDGEVFTQHYSAGGKSKLMPSADGEFLVAEDPEDPPAGLNDGSNLGIFFASLDQLAPSYADKREEHGVSVLDGLRVHLKNRVPPGQIEGKNRNPVLCVSKVYTGGAAGAKGNKGTSSKANGADKEVEETAGEGEGGEDSMESRVEAAVMKLLKKTKEPMTRAELMKGLGQHFEGAEKREAVEVLVTPGFLKNAEAPWSWDGKLASIE